MVLLDGVTQTLQSSASRMRLVLNAAGTLVGTSGSRYENTVNLLGATMTGPLIMDGAVNVLTNEISNLNSGANMSVAGLTSINDGVLRVAVASTLGGAGALLVNNGGVLDVQGSVVKNTMVAQDGIVRGVGQLTGTIDIDGFLDPGNSAGTIGIDGSVDLGSTSTVCIEIGGTNPGTGGFDVVDGRGANPTLNLGGGSLQLSLINGFVPSNTDNFLFFRNFTSISGSFGGGGNANRSNNRIYFADGSFAIDYSTTSIVLSDYLAAVPEPGGGLLLLATGMLLATRRSRPALA
jgi:hypothetical protein